MLVGSCEFPHDREASIQVKHKLCSGFWMFSYVIGLEHILVCILYPRFVGIRLTVGRRYEGLPIFRGEGKYPYYSARNCSRPYCSQFTRYCPLALRMARSTPDSGIPVENQARYYAALPSWLHRVQVGGYCVFLPLRHSCSPTCCLSRRRTQSVLSEGQEAIPLSDRRFFTDVVL